MSEPRPGFQRDVKAVVDAFNAGMQFEPPAISVTEFRESLRMVGMPLHDDDDLIPPTFDLPPLAEDGDDTEEEAPDGDEPA